MSERIVVGWDDSPGAEPAVRWAARTSARLSHTLRVVLAVRTASDPRAKALATAREQAEQAAPGLSIETKVINGHPIETLRDESSEAAMVVVGTRGHSRLTSTLVGSIGEDLTLYALAPVVVVRGDSHREPTAPVVVGVDGSETSSAAIRFAAAFAATMGSSLLAVAAAPDPLRGGSRGTVREEKRAELVHRQDAERFLAEALAKVRKDHPGLLADSKVLAVEPSEALVQAAADAQLLVVGSRGRGSFAGTLLGSVSRSVLHHAPCPVAVVRPGQTLSA